MSINLPTNATFYHIPNYCYQENSTFISCLLKSGNALLSNHSYSFEISIDINRLAIRSIHKIIATASSSGDEAILNNNNYEISILNVEKSYVAVQGFVLSF